MVRPTLTRTCSSQALKAHPGLRLFSACAIKDCSAHFAYASFATAVIDGLFSSRSSRLSNSPRLTPLVRPTLTRTCSSQLRVSFAHLCTRLHSLSAAALSSFDLCFAPVGISRQCARLSYVAYRWLRLAVLLIATLKLTPTYAFFPPVQSKIAPLISLTLHSQRRSSMVCFRVAHRDSQTHPGLRLWYGLRSLALAHRNCV